MSDAYYMQRCIELARRGAGSAAPNPMVGCVIVHEGNIISEGWHRAPGKAHAERDAILKLQNKELLKSSKLYVNLEPCAHTGRTPPCASLITEYRIPEVVYGCRDPFTLVDGKGLDHLTQAGVKVTGPVLQEECEWLNRRFLHFHQKKQPYIILKWAETADGFMAPLDGSKKQISGAAAQTLLHKWRSEEQAIMVGVNTLLADTPQLNVRLWHGKSPRPVFIDPQLRGEYSAYPQALVLNAAVDKQEDERRFIFWNESSIFDCLNQTLYEENILSVLVEGGKTTLQQLLDAHMWNEIRVIKSKTATWAAGVSAPHAVGAIVETLDLNTDTITIYKKQ
jgi:diaminohydroxyphosphoribosylaminopyrimidine deaminase/5-amino-6-(5-phosphoribosylamino)uracil reductase